MAKEEKKLKGKPEKKGKWLSYKTEGGLKRERKSCPKCGAGVFMAQHEDRMSCGKCSYTEFIKEKIVRVFPEHQQKKHKAKEPEKEAPKEKAE